jgi:hypothetical protein
MALDDSDEGSQSAGATGEPVRIVSRLRRWGVGVLLAYSLLHFAESWLWAGWHVRGGDVLSAFPGRLVAGRERFAADTVAVQYASPTWNYGPITHFWTYPLGFTQSVPRAMRILLVVNLLLLAASFIVWLRELAPSGDRQRALVAMLIVWLNSFPMIQAFVGREIEILEFALLTGAFFLLRRNRDVSAGTLIGLAAMTKYLPVIFVPYLLLKKRWRASAAALTTILIVAVLGQALLGFQHSVTFRRTREWTAEAVFRPHADNQALANVVQRLVTTGMYANEEKVTPRYPAAARALGLTLQLGITGLVFLALWRRRHGPVVAWEFGLVLMTMIIVPPWSNIYYLLFLVVPFSAAFLWGWRAAATHDRTTLVLAYVLASYVLPIGVIAAALALSPTAARNLLGHLSLPGLGMLLLFATFWALEPREPKAPL